MCTITKFPPKNLKGKRAYKYADANNVDVPITWEVHRATKPGGEATKLRFQAAWLLAQGNWEAIFFLLLWPRLLRRRWLLSFRIPPTPRPWELQAGPRVIAGSSLQKSWYAYSRYEQVTANKNTWFSPISLRVVGSLGRRNKGSRRRLCFSPQAGRKLFQVYQKEQALQIKWKLKKKGSSCGAWNVSHDQK